MFVCLIVHVLGFLFSSHSSAVAVRSLRGPGHTGQRPATRQRLLRGRPGDVQLRGRLHAQRLGAVGVRTQFPVEPPPPELRWYVPKYWPRNEWSPARFSFSFFFFLLFIIGIKAAIRCCVSLQTKKKTWEIVLSTLPHIASHLYLYIYIYILLSYYKIHIGWWHSSQRLLFWTFESFGLIWS